jgi:hypothetical protein
MTASLASNRRTVVSPYRKEDSASSYTAKATPSMNRLKGENWLENEHIFRIDSSKLLKLALARIDDDSCKRGTKYPIDRHCGGSIAECARWTPNQRHWCQCVTAAVGEENKEL